MHDTTHGTADTHGTAGGEAYADHCPFCGYKGAGFTREHYGECGQVRTCPECRLGF